MNKEGLVTPKPMRPQKGALPPTPLRTSVYEVFERIPELQVPERKGRIRWLDPVKPRLTYWAPRDELIDSWLRQAAIALKHCVEVNPKKLGGRPTLRGSRFSVAQVLSQLADGDNIDDLAENFELDRDQLATVLHALAAYLDKSPYR